VSKSKSSPRGIIPWIGGKGALADRIIPLFPPHHCYVEVFAGAGSILFTKPESRVEILNDINLELVTLYRVIKHHLDEFIRYLRWLLTAREEFERFKATDPATLTDVQRAVRFYYLHRNAFAPGLPRPVFRCDTTHKARFNLVRIEEDLSQLHLRLAGVFVENLPYATAIERFDKPTTFFYLDPPYHGCEKYYGKGIFAREDFARLAEQLGAIKGRFVMSINDHPDIRKLFRRFTIRTVATRYKVGKARQKPVRELLISGPSSKR
jgi:DNA adenine methylase